MSIILTTEQLSRLQSYADRDLTDLTLEESNDLIVLLSLRECGEELVDMGLLPLESSTNVGIER